MRHDKKNMIIELTFKFALEVIKYCELLETQEQYIIARQLLRSGTSIGDILSSTANAIK